MTGQHGAKIIRVVGPGGLIAALVVRRAVRVDGRDSVRRGRCDQAKARMGLRGALSLKLSSAPKG